MEDNNILIMNILIVRTEVHDDSATLISQNKIYAIEFERISRIKYNCNQKLLTFAYLKNEIGKYNVKTSLDKIKKKAILYLLNCAKINSHDIDIFNGKTFNQKYRSCLAEKSSHHKNHAATAFYPSEFKEAAVLVVDVFGSTSENNPDLKETVSFWHGKDKTLNHIKTYFSPAYQFNDKISSNYNYHNSIGVFYMDLTTFCGFQVLEAGKTMGLSPYGTDKILLKLKKYIDINEKDGLVTFKRDYTKLLLNLRKDYKDFFRFQADVAFAAQKILEECILFYCNKLYDITNCKNICLAGGVALNSVANGLIIKKTPFEEIFIQPASNDAGQSLGQALNYFYEIKDNKKINLDFNNFYLGKKYKYNLVINKLKKSTKINIRTFKKFEDVCKITAKLLENNNIIAWFQGRGEFGPRALGNRSILCNPCNKEMKFELNKRVKFREWFRPFAPVVLEESVQNYFETNTLSPHMLLVAPVKNKKIPSVTHIDNSARLQSVNIKQNRRLYLIIKQFFKNTGVPVLLNTSFNIKGEPIVETPIDAIKTFLNSNIDILVLGNNIISKKTDIHYKE